MKRSTGNTWTRCVLAQALLGLVTGVSWGQDPAAPPAPRDGGFPLSREPAALPQPAPVAEPFVPQPTLGADPDDDIPNGWTGSRRRRAPLPPDLAGSDYFPVVDRWRLGFPVWDRYWYGSPANPYQQNVLKGDYPIIGDDIFFALTAFSDTFGESRRLPGAAGANINQGVFRQTNLFTFDLFQWNNFFRPANWFLRVTPAMVITDTTKVGTNRDGALQEAFFDKLLAIVTDYYDTMNFRIGRQGFVSDFRGFLFSDVNDAMRLFGTYDGNRTQWNLFSFYTVKKDPFSLLNTFDSRRQVVAGGNIFRQDFLTRGFNVNGTVLYDGDRLLNAVDAFYIEVAGDGHIGRVNVSGAFIQALGHDDFNPIARRGQTINAQMLAGELVYPIDWFFPKVSALWASGDANPRDGQARGFDAVFDNPLFAGNGFSYANREALAPGKVILANGFSFLPNLRNKVFAPVNFVNPGLLLLNAGFDATVTARLKASFNVNYYRLNHTAPAALAFQQANNGKTVVMGAEEGVEPNIGLVYKPLIVDNVVVTFGSGVLLPGNAIKALSGSSEALYNTFGALTLIY